MSIDKIMRSAPVIPVLVLEQQMDWTELAETFVEAGLPVLEITLRTPLALAAGEPRVFERGGQRRVGAFAHPGFHDAAGVPGAQSANRRT